MAAEPGVVGPGDTSATEGSLLSVKATKFPGKELKWDSKKLAITNHDEANKTIVKRDYRKGFEPVRVGKA